jgi:hypothetical protein
LELDLAERRSKFNVTQVLAIVPTVPTVPGSINLDNEDTLPVK